uniref:Uncharacterized protein n=1 Tax=Arundo donax TaxID=35708 RepID=A0A0A8YFP3_ARUDO
MAILIFVLSLSLSPLVRQQQASEEHQAHLD